MAKKNQLRELTARHYKCIDMLIYSGLTQQKIAEEIGVVDETVCKWKKDSLFMKEYDKRLDIADKNRKRAYRAKANKALKKLEDLLDCENPQVALNAAKEIIHLAGDDIQKIEVGTKEPMKIEVDYGDS